MNIKKKSLTENKFLNTNKIIYKLKKLAIKKKSKFNIILQQVKFKIFLMFLI